MLDKYLEKREERINDETFAFFRGFKYALAFSLIFYSLVGASVWYLKYHKTKVYVDHDSKRTKL